METIFVLVQAEIGAIEPVLNEIRTKEGVSEAYAVTGAFDVIAKVEGDDLSQILSTLVRDIRKTDGIKRTETLVVLKL